MPPIPPTKPSMHSDAPIPSLKPAYILKALLAPPLTLGAASTGGSELYVPIIRSTLETVGSFTPHISSSTSVTGGDFIHRDPDGKHLRLDVRGVQELDGKSAGGHLGFGYKGIISVTPEIDAVLGGDKTETKTEWGKIVTGFEFQGVEGVGERVWVGSGRFVVTNGELWVEYHIFEVLGN